MEYCNGGDLKDLLELLNEEGNWEDFENMIFEIAKQMSNALLGLCSIWNKKVFIHKDIKPDNIFVKIGRKEKDFQKEVDNNEKVEALEKGRFVLLLGDLGLVNDMKNSSE